MTAAAQPYSPIAYLADAMRLREVVEWNRYDTEFQRKDGTAGKIVPVVDANVVSFYMEPASKLHLIDLFGLTQITANSDHGKLLTFARITAEFLFLSRPVLIGNERGQLWADAPLLTPGHSGEIERILHSLESTGNSIYREAALTTEAQVRDEKGVEANLRIEEFTAASKRQTRKSEDPSGPLRESVGSLVDALDKLFGPSSQTEERVRKLLQAQRWMRLMEDSGVRPLATHPLADRSVLAPEQEDIDAWLPDLLQAKTEKANDRDAERLARNDIEAILQVEALNRRALERPLGRTPLRFVLISGDEALHRVYAKRFWSWAIQETRDNQAREPQQKYILRRPLQYSPVLNLKDIPNGYKATSLFDELLETVDTLTPYVPHRTCGAYSLIHDLTSKPPPFPRRAQDDLPSNIERLKVLWRQAIEASSALCAALAVKDYGLDALSARLDTLASREGGDTALIELQRSIFSDIESLHVRLLVPELSFLTAKANRRRSTLAHVSGPRLPMLVQDDFADVTKGVPIEDFASNLWRGEVRSPGVLSRLERMLKDEGERHRVFFFAGAAAAAMNEFEIASQHLRRAASLNGRTSNRSSARFIYEESDIAYLRLALDRVRMRTVREYDAAVARHKRLAKNLTDTSFEGARAQSEFGSLHLMHYFNICFVLSSKPALSGERGLAATAAEIEISKAHKSLPQLRLRKAADEHLLQRLGQQVNTNRICVEVIKSGFFEVDAASDEGLQTQTISATLLAELPQDDHIVNLWDCVGLWLSKEPRERLAAANKVVEVCAPLLAELSRLDEAHRPPADLPAIKYIIDRARQEVTILAT